MRALSALPLDDDIIDRIMTYCPTFQSLQAMILASKAFYAVYQSHPKSIVWAVASNLVGHVLPQALRAIRYPDTFGAGKEEPDVVAKMCPEDYSPSLLTKEDKRKLHRDVKAVQKLEDMFSMIEKYHRSRTSVLTPEESFRFRRAVYRVWVYCRRFSGDRYDLDEIDELGDAGVALTWRQRTAMLNVYHTPELLQMYAVMRFFRETLKKISEEDDEPYPDTLIDILLSTGPDSVERAYDARATEHIEDMNLAFRIYEVDDDTGLDLYNGYFSRPLGEIWTERGVKPPNDDDRAGAAKLILDTVVEKDDKCSQCATGGLALFTEANWHRLCPSLAPASLLKNKLKSNQTVLAPFLKLYNNNSDDDKARDKAVLPDSDSGSDRDEDADADKDDDGDDAWEDVSSDGHNDDGSEDRDEGDRMAALIGKVFDFAASSVSSSGASEAVGATASSTLGSSGWMRNLSYCRPCLEKFLADRAWKWFLAERVKGGWTKPEDCWYGYNCNTMTHKKAHAEGKNHLCEPIKGN
ncbi:hypothetical protein DFH08DRAFT_127839 [Mycena albidolilacea]|uniref:Aprataxin and PNK-like factor PBZ domain-containing protein n=1 Tax=Mycena albidolilacea TaxID=1033008 RepID=A0AAD6YWS3_9AGAR|nr:hypothetical protein DFH08DRAFT_127839 [Mycena albidolilacea]